MSESSYYVLVVPDSGPAYSLACDTREAAVLHLRHELEKGGCSLFVFKGERLHLSEEPRHLLDGDEAVPLFDPRAAPQPADSAYIPAMGLASPFAAVSTPPPAAPTAAAAPGDDWDDELDDEDDDA